MELLILRGHEKGPFFVVEDSIEEIVCQRITARRHIVGRVDLSSFDL